MNFHGKDIKIFAANSVPQVAEQIARHLGLPLGDAEVKTFSDGEIAVSINESVRGSDVFVVQSTCSPVNDHLMDLHASQIQGFFDIPVDHLQGVPLLAPYFVEKFKDFAREDLVVVSPDLGSVTRARKFADRLGAEKGPEGRLFCALFCPNPRFQNRRELF